MQYNINLIKKITISAIVIILIVVIQLFYGIAYVPTESMEPTIEAESLVFVQKRNFEPTVGNIYIYKNSTGKKIIHRIKSTKIENSVKKYEFKGDNNKKVDEELVDKSSIKSKYLWHSHILGVIYKYIKAIIVVVCSVLGVYFIYKDNKENNN